MQRMMCGGVVVNNKQTSGVLIVPNHNYNDSVTLILTRR
jgi:hypothetical protein